MYACYQKINNANTYNTNLLNLNISYQKSRILDKSSEIYFLTSCSPHNVRVLVLPEAPTTLRNLSSEIAS